jgi:very-short-patch-repair endonuclease
LQTDVHGPLRIHCTYADQIGAAFHQNAIPAINELALQNDLGRELQNVLIELTSEPSFTRPVTWRVDDFREEAIHRIENPDVGLDSGFLNRLTEAVRGCFTVIVREGEHEIARHSFDVHLLPPSHWTGSSAAPQLLAAFVRPNDPAVDQTLRIAASKLESAHKSNVLDGYASGRKGRVWEIAEGIWAAMVSYRIAYVLPPASFEKSGQKVRCPSDVLEHRLGTCLDTTLFYAACIEQAGLHPLIILTEGHAFVGIWLKSDLSSDLLIEDSQGLRKRRDLEELVCVETTLVTTSSLVPFKESAGKGGSLLNEEGANPFELAIDIFQCRKQQLRPLDLGDGSPNYQGELSRSETADLEVGETPAFQDEIATESVTAKPTDRVGTWKRRLLDLTLRNKMLNFKAGSTSIELECPDPINLEDRLNKGQKFKLSPRSEILSEGDPRSAELLENQRHQDGRELFLRESLDRGEIFTTQPKAELDARLTELFRNTRTAFEEGGANTLFLALGFLKWKAADASAASLAPLLLIPVALERKSVVEGFKLKLHEDEPSLNPTLLELLRLDFGITFQTLERELPRNEEGLDVAKIWRTTRAHVRDLNGWELVEKVVVSTFSFTKYLMWKDLQERTDALKENAVVKHLVETPSCSFSDGIPFLEPRELDQRFSPGKVFTPLSADSSQLAAVLAAAAGKNFVLRGPPGTGKSQTIANIIAQCVAEKKTVLFVSQKTAALEVVQRRLRDIGLGNHILEIHSAKAQKSLVLNQLKNAWHSRSFSSRSNWTEATQELETTRSELNRLVFALHLVRSNGLTAYQGFGTIVAKGASDLGTRFVPPPGSDPSRDQLKKIKDWSRELAASFSSLPGIVHHPLREIRGTNWSPNWARELVEVIDQTIETLPKLRELLVVVTAEIGFQGLLMTKPSAGALAQLFQLAAQEAFKKAFALARPHGDIVRAEIKKLKDLQEQAKTLKSRLKRSYEPTVFDLDFDAWLQRWTEANNAFFLFRGFKRAAVRKVLNPHSPDKVQGDIGKDLFVLHQLATLREQAAKLGGIQALFGKDWAGLDTGTGEMDSWVQLSDQISDLFRSIESDPSSHSAGSQLLSFLSGLTSQEVSSPPIADLSRVWNQTDAVLTRLSELTRVDPIPSSVGWIDELLVIVSRWKANLGRASAWMHWNSISEKGPEIGLQSLVDRVRRDEIPHSSIEEAAYVAYVRWWIDQVVSEDATLRSFIPAKHERTIARFQELDERVNALSRQELQGLINQGVPDPNGFGTDPEWGTLSREISKKTRHLPLRRLFEKIPNALLRLAPCVMMSPLSIAQHLAPNTKLFDVVIFDEASQIPVWDAIGALARGRQALIVGDPEQLPPTNFGERTIEDEDNPDVEPDQESILDECLSANLPERSLNWHYRSQFESLINFSNQRYYKGALVTFPPAKTEDGALRYIHVPNGVYERGTGRVNRQEATAVVNEIVKRLRSRDFVSNRSSLGVVTFNGPQQRLIEDLLDDARRANPGLETFFDPEQCHEPVFVKNLENVQGDERDIIIFSVAFGPDGAGKVSSQISSLNKKGGHRRLNVAITRARSELLVFATLRPEQIDLARSTSQGIVDFKHFLEYADGGQSALAKANAPTGEDTESPFEDAVMHALTESGWQVHPQVGVSGFRVDLGIVHPDYPGRYLAGVECDGATYHSHATARDRDRLREVVLTRLGWRIRRVWSTEWWQGAEEAAARLHDQLARDLVQDRTDLSSQKVKIPAALAPTSQSLTPINIARDAAQQRQFSVKLESDLTPDFSVDEVPSRNPVYASAANNGAQPKLGSTYEIADLASFGALASPRRFYEIGYQSVLKEMAAYVIQKEGPIFSDLLIRRIARAHGFARSGGKIRETILAVINSDFPTSKQGEDTLLWPMGVEPTDSVDFRNASLEIRGLNDIPDVELIGLAKAISRDGQDSEATLLAMASAVGIGRITDGIRHRLINAIDRCSGG